MVIAHSSEFLYRLVDLPRIGEPIHYVIDKIHYSFGLLGVELFFVLSGFLIGNILIKTFINSGPFTFRDVRGFWVRRWFRTLPLYWLILTADIVLYNVMNLNSHEMSKAFDYFFLQNLWYPHPLYFFGEAWSLAVEEWFYLTLPIAILISALVFKPVDKKKFLLRVFIGYLLVFATIRFINAFHPINGPDQDIGIRKVVVFRLDAVMYGVLMAWLASYCGAMLFKLRHYLLAVGAAGIVVIFYLITGPGIHITNPADPHTRFASNAFLYLFIPLLFSLWLPFAYHIKTIRSPYAARFVTHISKISYSMYLVHYGLIFIPFYYNYNNPSHKVIVALYILYWVIVILLSSLLYKYYEYPIMRLRDKFSRKNSGEIN